MTQLDPILVCDRVTRRFGSLVAVDSVSMSVRPGEIVGIGGPNGAGKTTLFDTITRMTACSSGRIEFDGRDVTEASADRVCQMGMARTFQLNADFEHMTVLENAEIAAYFGRTRRLFPGLRMGSEARRQAVEALEFVGLAEKSHRMVAELPVLDRKLLMIASAMATSPKLLFLDEPVGGLNAQEIDRVMVLVRRVADAGLTIVLIEHVMRFLLALSSRVIIMHHGSLLFEGRPEEVAENDSVVDVYLGQGTRDRLKRYYSGGNGDVA